VTQPTSGLASVSVNPLTGIVTYTPNGFIGSDTFTYTVQDNGAPALTSNVATVTVNVTGTSQTVAVTRAEFRTVTPGLSGDWRLEGTGTPGAQVTIHVGSTLAGTVLNGAPITIDGAGKWLFQAAASPVLPGPTNTISVVTNGGAVRLAFPVAAR
jgi:hypothetical protein